MSLLRHGHIFSRYFLIFIFSFGYHFLNAADIQDIKNGMSNVTCTYCGDGIPNDSMWQCLDNAEQLVIDKYGSDQDKLTALREDRYVKAMTAKFPYESKVEANKIIDATSQEIKDKNRHLPMRR